MLRIILNVLWLVLSGFWLAAAYLVAGVLMCVTIIGIPFGLQAFKLAGYAFWPFGRALAPTGKRPALSLIGNIIWFVLAGWWLAIGHVITGVALCLTIIGIPLGIADFKMAGAALVPFGKEVVRLAPGEYAAAGMIAVDTRPRDERS
ncbi:MAG TPA: YccF domain-containing protein [Gaiellales bacterium]|nr:YccF domain-containing protein [Gaiellales bacterium]